MTFSKSGKAVPGRIYEMHAMRNDSSSAFIKKAARALKLNARLEELVLYTYSGAAIVTDSDWTLARYASLKKKNLGMLKFGIGCNYDETQSEVSIIIIM